MAAACCDWSFVVSGLSLLTAAALVLQWMCVLLAAAKWSQDESCRVREWRLPHELQPHTLIQYQEFVPSPRMTTAIWARTICGLAFSFVCFSFGISWFSHRWTPTFNRITSSHWAAQASCRCHLLHTARPGPRKVPEPKVTLDVLGSARYSCFDFLVFWSCTFSIPVFSALCAVSGFFLLLAKCQRTTHWPVSSFHRRSNRIDSLRPHPTDLQLCSLPSWPPLPKSRTFRVDRADSMLWSPIFEAGNLLFVAISVLVAGGPRPESYHSHHPVRKRRLCSRRCPNLHRTSHMHRSLLATAPPLFSLHANQIKPL